MDEHVLRKPVLTADAIMLPVSVEINWLRLDVWVTTLPVNDTTSESTRKTDSVQMTLSLYAGTAIKILGNVLE